MNQLNKNLRQFPLPAQAITQEQSYSRDIDRREKSPSYSFRENGRLLPSKRSPENDLLSSMSLSILSNILPFMERVNFTSDQQIFKSGDPISHIYFPETAIVSEYQILEDGRTVEVAMIGKESATGLPSIFNDATATNWSQITIAGSALRIKVSVLRNELLKNDSLQKKLFQNIDTYVKRLSQSIVCHCHHTVEERFCSWLLMVHDRKPGVIKLTHEKMARALGVHRPSLTRIVQILRDKTAFECTRGQIHILDRQRLMQFACSCHMM